MNPGDEARGRSRLPLLGVGATALLLLSGCARADTPADTPVGTPVDTPVGTPPVPAVAEGEFRVATWNIRFFPEPSTDVERTAQLLAGLDADLIAVQEIADADTLAAMLARVNALLSERASGSGLAPARHYDFELSASGGHGGQFVGYIYDRNALELSRVETLTRLQMTPDLRPGLFAHVKSLRGGLDFQVIVMHTDSGTKDRDYGNRLRFLDSLAAELPARRATDADIIVLGDLNTMGRLAEDGLPRVRAEDEIANLDERARGMGLRRLPSSPACTEYYRGRGSLLDHILVSPGLAGVTSMTGDSSGAAARVFGYCADFECRPVDPDHMPYDYVHVSDHCPVVIDLVDSDRD